MTTAEVRTSVAAAGATLLGALALGPVFATGGWFPPVLAVVVSVLLGGLLLRTVPPALWQRVRPGRPLPRLVGGAGVVLLPIAQLALLGCVLTALYAPGQALWGVLPTPGSLAALGEVFVEGASEMREQAPPALPLTGLLALTALLVGLIAVAVDLVAVGGGQATLAGLGLLVLFCIPVSTITGGVGVLAIAGPAAGLALLLWTDQRRRLAVPRQPGRHSALGTGTVAALRTGFVALAVGLLVGAVVPTLPEGSFGSGLGPGGGAGGSTGTALDPVAALQGQLTLPQPIDLLRVDASVDDPGYLRAVALDSYDGETGWSLSNLDGQTSVADDHRLAPLPARQDGRDVEATVTVLQHDDRFLPVPGSPLQVDVLDSDDEAWRFDRATGTVFGRGVTTAGRTYRVTATEPTPSAELLAEVDWLPADDPVQQRFTQVSPLHPSVADLLRGLLADADTPYDAVRAVHQYLTDRANGFVYSLATDPGTSDDDLADFLRNKRGYCEQYAGAMAVLVRAAGVPARVALGYTPGTEQPDGTRLITSDDAHAWVEVYFDDLGWVPFDPTPIAASRAVDLPWAPGADQTDDRAGAPLPTSLPSAGPSARLDRDDQFTPLALPGEEAAWVRPALFGAAGVLLLAGLTALPGALRARQRRARLADGSVGALWDELSATALDLGIRPNPAATPRQTARQLAARVAGPAPAVELEGGRRVRRPDRDRDAVDGVRRLALAEETASYGRPGAVQAAPELVLALRAARRGMMATAPRRARLRARIWPESLVVGTRARLAARFRGLLGGLRRRVRPV
jgi:transglutaminase-like putative cysteine protease